MFIHNTTEDLVLTYLEEVLNIKKDICKCEQCRIDMACFALNRVKPMYVVSSRGMIHTENQKRDYIQDEIDIYSTVMQAVDTVSKTRRHDIKEEYKIPDISGEKITPEYKSESGCFFNFPQIVGRIFVSTNLEPVTNGKISLYYESGKKLVSMFNKNWPNPSVIVPQMSGTFTFWPAPIPAEKPGIQKDFYMYLEIEKEGYQGVCKFFFLRAVSSNKMKPFIEKEKIFYINDIFINPDIDSSEK